MVKGYIRNRFNKLRPTDVGPFHNYIFQTSLRKGPGERAMMKVMEMPILARTPIYNELDNLKDQGIDIWFVYGDRDWIDTNMSGIHVSQLL
mmetsp:Transcript_16368/g.18201  ORF Transcript_16368/g.18201 Transcript_16368/m.18201 type:complete len:91 (+) Transcript_16368:402-674(+)